MLGVGRALRGKTTKICPLGRCVVVEQLLPRSLLGFGLGAVGSGWKAGVTVTVRVGRSRRVRCDVAFALHVPNWVSANISAGGRASGFLLLHVSDKLK